MNTELQPPPSDIERVLIGGDLAQLKPEQRLSYYNHLCDSLGLNPLTKPFQYLNLSGKTVLYATKDCTEQLRKINSVSVKIVAREVTEGCYVVTAQAALPSGRCDESIGAVPIENVKGEARSNAIMKCETKAKRRVTLSICGLGMLDESETESIPGARPFEEGSKEAQQNVADRKIKELSAPLVAEAERNLQFQPDASYADRHAALIIEANEILEQPSVNTSKPKGIISFAGLKKWGELKTELRKLTGTDTIYYAALKAKGYDHANEIANEKDTKAIWTALATERTRLNGEEDLKLVFGQCRERLGGARFLEILGANGCESIADALRLGGTALNALQSDLKQAVDDLQPMKV